MANKALILTLPGITDVCASEAKKLTGISGKETKEAVVMEAELKDIFTICYRSQTATRVILVVSEGKIDELNIPKEYLEGTISITGKSNTQAQQFLERIPAKKVYKNADTPFYLHSENEYCWLGIDLTGDISKRDYRIFTGSETLAGPTAFGALQIAGYDAKHTLLDPFCRAGSIVIEAAMQALNFPPRYYSKEKLPFVKLFNKEDINKFFSEQDKNIKEQIPGKIFAVSEQFPSVQATRKNAQIAGVLKALTLKRIELEWLDLKFEPNSTDLIVTQPTEHTKNIPQNKFKKLVKLFLERSKTILKKDGKTCMVLRQGMEEYKTTAKQYGFTPEHERTIMQGKEKWTVLLLKPA